MMETQLRRPIHEVWTKAGPVETTASDDGELRRVEERHQVEIGEATPLGLFGFATGTLIAGFVLSGLVPYGSLTGIIPAVLIFAGIGQFVAGLFALAKGNTFAGTAMGSFGAGNVLITAFIWMQKAGLIGSAHADSILMGVALCCLGYIALALTVSALRLNMALVVTLAALTPGYILTGIRDFGAPAAIGHIGGGFLLLSALLAFYTGAALVINSTHEREALAMGSLSPKGTSR